MKKAIFFIDNRDTVHVFSLNMQDSYELRALAEGDGIRVSATHFYMYRGGYGINYRKAVRAAGFEILTTRKERKKVDTK